MTQISGISTTETALSNVAYMEGERTSGESVKIPPSLIRPSGTSFPGSPATDTKFYRTDRNIEYFYDGTRWLSTTLYHAMPAAGQRAPQPLSATANPLAFWVSPHSTTYDIYIEVVRHQAVMTGAGNWTIQLQDNAGAVITQVANITGSNFSNTAVNATAPDYRLIRSAAIENSGTATLDYIPAFSYRLVG